VDFIHLVERKGKKITIPSSSEGTHPLRGSHNTLNQQPIYKGNVGEKRNNNNNIYFRHELPKCYKQ
jgi:hypothetical protein